MDLLASSYVGEVEGKRSRPRSLVHEIMREDSVRGGASTRISKRPLAPNGHFPHNSCRISNELCEGSSRFYSKKKSPLAAASQMRSLTFGRQCFLFTVSSRVFLRYRNSTTKHSQERSVGKDIVANARLGEYSWNLTSRKKRERNEEALEGPIMKEKFVSLV